MSAPYQYAPPPAMPAQRPAGGGFDLDELLGTRPAPPPPPAPPQQQPAYGGYATAQPAPPPPPPNEDPFGFNTQWQPQQQQQQAPPPPPPQPQPQPQQQQPLQASYQYGAPAPAPVAYAQPPASPGYAAPPAAQPQPTYAAPPQQQQQQQQPGYAPTAPQQPMSRYDPYYAQQQQQQQPPQPVQAPQPAPTPYAYGGQPQVAAVNQAPPQTAAPTAYAYPAAAAAQPQPTAAYVYPASPQQQQQQAPVASPQQQQPPAEWTPQRQGSAQYAAVMQQAPQPQPQPQPVPVAYGYPGAVAPTPQPAVTYAAVASGYPVPVAPIQPQQPTYNEDQDRANLERIRRLREQLEREQAAEAAAMAARNGGGGVVASVGTTATTGLAAPSDGWQCRTCTFKNALSATACQMCDEARPGYSKPVPAQQQPPSTAVATGQVIRASATNASSGGDWTCQMCQGRNAPISGICKICNSPRVIESTPVATPSAPANVWACTNCTLHNPNTLMRCQACDYMKPGAPSRNAASVVAPPPPPPVQSLPSVPANWNCTTCTFENSVEAPACSMCATPRPSHVTDAINARQRAMAQQQSTTNVLPFEASVNGRRLTPEEQERLVRQQAQILEAIQRQQQLGGNTSTNAGRTAPSGARVVAPPQHDSDDEDPDEPVQWQKDTDAKQCNKCSAAFGVFLRRHHCRSCGFVFCKNCCGNFMTLKTGGKTERVCNDCHKEKTSPAPVVSRPPVAASYPVQQPARDTRPAVQAVPRISCDCVAAAEGFHRPGCHNNPSSLASFL